jgi:hypothetical protein
VPRYSVIAIALFVARIGAMLCVALSSFAWAASPALAANGADAVNTRRRHVYRASGHGLTVLKRRIVGLERRYERAGRPLEKTAGVSDIDDTLTDGRFRTLAFTPIYASKRGLRLPRRLSVEDMGYDGRLTALNLEWGATEAEHFHQAWEEFFWRPESFRLDKPIEPVVGLLRRAAAVPGVGAFHSTGRDSTTRAGTLAQLAELEIPGADEGHLFTKRPGQDTTAFKRRVLERLLDRGYTIEWFITDTAAEINAVLDLPVNPVYIEFPVRMPEEQPIADGVPVLRVE